MVQANSIRLAGGDLLLCPHVPSEKPCWCEARVITSTIGASEDLASEDLRRIFVNSVYWGLGMDDKIPKKSDVDYVDDFTPTPFGRNKFKKGLRPQDYALKGE